MDAWGEFGIFGGSHLSSGVLGDLGIGGHDGGIHGFADILPA